MSLPRYPQYKDSGVAWAVQLPAHWGTASLKWLSQRYSGGTPDKNRLEFWEDGTIPWLNSGAVNDGRIYEASAYITQEAFENSSAKWIPPGALLIALAGQGKTKGMVAQLMFESTCNQSMAAIVPTEKIDARCLYWWLISNYQNIRNMAGGDLRDGLNLDLLGAIPCPLPTLKEQTAIATFLDRETGKIDALIAEQEKLLALLAEKRQATISHAVTKGLNPDAPMKDSGVAWLGEVPEHWTTCPLASRYSVQLGKMLDASKNTGEHLRPYLRVFDVQWGDINIDDLPMMDFDEDARIKFRLMPGDILVNEGGSYPGRSAIWTGNLDECYYQKALHRIRPLNPERDLSGFFYYVMSWAANQGVFMAGGNETTIEHLPAEKLRRYRFAYPPFQEQADIASFLDNETTKLDALKTESERAITLLKERRSALIAAAVTGQIDVRESA
mgnify:CR=1 FL=1